MEHTVEVLPHVTDGSSVAKYNIRQQCCQMQHMTAVLPNQAYGSSVAKCNIREQCWQMQQAAVMLPNTTDGISVDKCDWPVPNRQLAPNHVTGSSTYDLRQFGRHQLRWGDAPLLSHLPPPPYLRSWHDKGSREPRLDKRRKVAHTAPHLSFWWEMKPF